MDEELIEVEEEQLEDDIDVEEEQLEDDIEVEEEQVQVVVNKDYEPLINKPKINNVELDGNLSLSDLGIDQDFVKDDGYVHTDNNYTSQEKDKLSNLHNYDDTEIRTELNNKVDKETGKGLSTNDYTDEEKTKLASLENYDDTEVKSDITNLQTNKADKSEIPDVSSFITKDVNNLTYYTLKTNTGSLIDLEINSSTYVVTLTLKDQDGNSISTDSIDLPLETVVVGGRYDSASKKVILTLENGNEIEFSVADLVAGLQTEITSNNKLASDLVDDTNSGNKFVSTSEKNTWNDKYDKPSGGIPKTDLDSSVQTSLGKADTALQEHQSLTDYVKFTDYGNNTDTTGVSRGGNYGFRISGAGVGYVQKASDNQVIAKENAYCPIVPSSLDLAVKTSIITNEIELTDEEKETAQNWLGIDEIVADAKGNNIKLTDSRANKIQSLNIYGKSSQTVNTGSNLTYMTSSNYIVKNAYAKFGTNIIIEDNGSSLYFPTGSVLTSANTRFLVYLLPTTADKWYTFQVEADPETSDIGVTFADYQPNPSSTSDRISALAAGKNISYTFKAEGDRVYCIEFRSPTNSEGVVTNNPTKVKVMFNEGGPKDWEPYTNGVATPTMTTPSPISSLTSETLTITDGVNTQTATLNLTTDGIPVSSGGNYTDENGQQYIADSIERYEDGTGKLIKRTYRQTLPNSFTKSGSSGNFLLAVSNLDYAPKLPSTQYVISYDVMCNQFTNDETWISQNGYVVVDGTKVSFADATEFNTYFAEHPLIYEYVLDTPIETNLTAEQLEQLDLTTYNGETQITSNTGVEINYIANAKKYVDNKIETGLINRDKYVLLAENTITEPSNTAVEWNSTGEDDIYDDIIVSCENMLGSAAGTGAVAYRLSNSNDNFTVSQSNLLSSSTVRTYWADCIRYLPNKWKFEKRGATNAVGDVTGNAVRIDTQFEDKINRVRFYAGSSVNFVQGTYRIYGRKRFE